MLVVRNLMLKIAICDDSNRDGSQLENLLLSYNDIKIETSVYTNPQKLLEQLTEKYSCVFLDIEMPQITGIDMAQKSVRETLLSRLSLLPVIEIIWSRFLKCRLLIIYLNQ